MPHVATSSQALDAYVATVDRILDEESTVERSVPRIAEANATLLGDGFRLPDCFRTLHPTAPYTRNLVFADPRRRFTVIAILWGPFQETRVHDHLNWCVVKVLEGRCLATDFERLDDERTPAFAELAIRDTQLVRAGAVCSLLPPPRSNIHRMANATRDVAISLHTYGDPGTKARVFDPVSGKVEIVELVFHNQ